MLYVIIMDHRYIGVICIRVLGVKGFDSKEL